MKIYTTMKCMSLLGLILILGSCATDDTDIVVQVLSCTDSASWDDSPQCRVETKDHGRVTVFGPVVTNESIYRRFDEHIWRIK